MLLLQFCSNPLLLRAREKCASNPERAPDHHAVRRKKKGTLQQASQGKKKKFKPAAWRKTEGLLFLTGVWASRCCCRSDDDEQRLWPSGGSSA
jgi:hypothetical protein